MAHIPTDLRRQQFIDAAVEVIARDGVDGATTRRIAEEAGAPLATLHYCFRSKENLLWAVYEQLADLGSMDIQKESAEGLSVALIAATLLHKMVQWGVDHPVNNRAQLEIWLWAERNDQELALRLYEKFLDSTKEVLRGATPRPDEEQLETVARVIAAFVDGLGMQLIISSDRDAIMRRGAAAIAMLEASLS
jgi:AcrR family transcriptional regulator